MRWFAAIAMLLWLGSLTAPVRSQTTLAPDFFVGASGEKKVGQYIWVWRTEKVPKFHESLIEADCPVGYAVTGGGYYQKLSGGVFESRPNGAFDGWIVEAGAGYSAANTVTAYAGCAPAS
jgi:hypothetical protein